VEAWDTPAVEIRTAFELHRALAAEARSAAAGGAFPLVLAGNCNSAVGALAGLLDEPIGLLWFDAHGDFHTPDTTESGFLDGMGLATAVGRGWDAMMARFGLRAIPEAHAALVGARDLDAAEREAIASSGVAWIPAAAIRELGAAALRPALQALRGRVRRAYLHVDLDVLDPSVCQANRLAAEAGLSLEQLRECIGAAGEALEVAGAGLASIEPAFERDGRTLEAALSTLEWLAAAARRPAVRAGGGPERA
jgi:arginase